jgi:hypothetical protein
MRLSRWATVAALGSALALSGCASTGNFDGPNPSALPTLPSTAAGNHTPVATPSPDPSPHGTWAGACDYTLGSDPVDGTAFATGDIELANTGNVGVVVKMKITWPQEGFAPLVMHKITRLHYGQSKDVQFALPMTGDQVDNLQNWQSSHGYKDGCTYHVKMTSTFGQVH